MRSIFLKLIIIVAFIASSCSPSVAQQTASKYEYQISVPFITAEIIDTTYRTPRVVFRSYPPRQVKVIDRFVYEIKLTLKLSDDDFTWREPIGIVCKLPDGGMDFIIINEKMNMLDSKRSYDFYFTVKNWSSGWMNVEQGIFNHETEKIIPDDRYKFLGNAVYLK